MENKKESEAERRHSIECAELEGALLRELASSERRVDVVADMAHAAWIDSMREWAPWLAVEIEDAKKRSAAKNTGGPRRVETRANGNADTIQVVAKWKRL